MLEVTSSRESWNRVTPCLFHTFFSFLARSIGPSSGGDPCGVLSSRREGRWASNAHCPNPRHQHCSRAALLGGTCHHNRTGRIQVVDRACGCNNFSFVETCSFSQSGGSDYRWRVDGEGWGEDYRDYKEVVVLTARVYKGRGWWWERIVFRKTISLY